MHFAAVCVYALCVRCPHAALLGTHAGELICLWQGGRRVHARTSRILCDEKVINAIILSCPCRGWYCEIPLISEGVYLQIEQAEQIGQGA